jgi:glycosyltransferase involved in cell wall biosynthesis
MLDSGTSKMTGDPSHVPQVAVVIPAHNPGIYLLESLESVLAQTIANELIIIDDGSDEGQLPDLPADPRVRTIRQENLGVSAARNRGTRETSAPLIAFLDADDRWAPNKLERQVRALAASPESILCYTGFSLIDQDGHRLAPGWATAFSGYRSLLTSNPILMSSVVVRRQQLTDVGGFDPLYSVVADWDLWLRLAAIGPFLFVPEALADYRMAPHGIGQMSGDIWTGYREAMSVYDRQQLRAARARDDRSLVAISHGRRAARQMSAERAAARFVDSIVLGSHPEWRMLYQALQIESGTAFRATARRATHRIRRRIGRLWTRQAHD